MNDLYSKLDKYFRYEKSDSVFIALVKSLILLVSGGYFGLSIKEINSTPQIIDYKHIGIFVFGISIFIYIEFRRLTKEKNFPISILNHLTATEELKELKEKYNRKSKIYEYIDLSIQSLNSNTCPVLFATSDNLLCRQDLNLGLKNVLNDLVESPNYFLEVDKTKFTVGVYLKDILDPKSERDFTVNNEKTFLFRDDLSINDYLPESLFEINSTEIEGFQIQTALLEVLNFDKFICRQINIDSEVHSIVCSPIPNVCESCPPEGIIFAIYKGNEGCQSDIDSVLLIFGRILSNWISKYNECVSRTKNLKSEETHTHKTIETQRKS
ncbi:hypothetical protein [Flavobacterium piscis]|uniref:Uncharacterized protein n=1 Tax=Flavobacterium piscis TaxID=1114874 RepID=A0ABU1Y9R2_9FLAO|nr:hypothetical protein [Flavobacterium piscis]MDR7210960.1 hypothetical protein [Flavobacterium piscis]